MDLGFRGGVVGFSEDFKRVSVNFSKGLKKWADLRSHKAAFRSLGGIWRSLGFRV